jgi:hypothetical protein
MASVLFGDIKTPYVNEITLKRLLVPRVKENIFQKIILRPEEAATEKFSNDTDAAELQIIRVKPNNKQARRIGSSVNGEYFNSENAAMSATAAYGIKILDAIDHNIDIPQNMQDMLNVDVAEAELQNLAGQVAGNINAVTVAAQLCKLLNTSYTNSDTSNIIRLNATPTGAEVKEAIIDANAILDDGNEEEGIETYPRENRAIIIRSSLNTLLKKAGGIIIGGSNYAQDILQKGGLDKDTRVNTADGYLGEVDGVPVYLLANPAFNTAARYLGWNHAMIKSIMGLVVSSIGTGRGLAFNAVMKIIDAPAGQGRRLQPKYRYGCECWDAKSVVAIVSNDFVNPSVGTLTVVPPASRAANYTVTYAKGSETATGTAPDADTVAAFGYVELPENPFALATKTFDGWKSSVDGKVYAEKAKYQSPAEDSTLTAQWK